MPTFLYQARPLHYTLVGSGPPLLFHHGLGSNCTQGPPLVADPNHALLCPDAPSHGNSAAAPDLHSFDALADAVIALLDHLEIDTAVLAGLSMGAGVSLNAALRHPSRVRALILLRPAWLDASNPDNLAVVARIGRWIESEGAAAARDRLAADTTYIDMLATNPNAAASLAALLDYPADRARVLYDMVADAPFPAMADLARIDIPALLISTDADPLHPIFIADRIAEALPNAEHHATPPRYLEPEAHTQALRAHARAFLDALGTR